MQYKNLIYISLLYFIPATAAGNDTTKVYKADEVVITATRSAINISDAPSTIQVVNNNEIQRINGTAIADVLRYVNGVDVRDYGATGGAKSVKLRGLSSENVAILIDGNPVNIAQYGSMDLSLLPLSAIDRMEVFYGGASALYGGNALGGIINLITRKATDGLHTRLQAEGGSFGSRKYSAEVSNRIFGLGLLANISHETGKDDFEFINHRTNISDTTMKRANADYKRAQFFISNNFQPNESIELNASLLYVKLERGVPGSISFPSSARQNDESYRFMVGSKYAVAENLSFRLSGIYNHDNQNYAEIISSKPTEILYKNRSFSVNVQSEFFPATWDRLIGGIEFSRNWLDADEISREAPFNMNPMREQKSAYLSNELSITNNAGWFDKLILYQTVRYDGYSDVKEDVVSPKVGINLRINRDYNIRARSSWGKNFRVPTFNDLYYPNYSNPKLAPERSTAFDVGILGSLEKSGRQTVEITYFNINTLDKIVLGANWLPYNIGKAENSGLEVRYDYHSLDSATDLYFSFTLTDAIKKNKDADSDLTYNKQLVYVPKSTGAFGVSIESELGRISINNAITGLRYTNADNSKSLSAYMLTDVVISKTISLSKFKIQLRGAIGNLFDVNYQSILDYPMPRRSFKLSLGVDY